MQGCGPIGLDHGNVAFPRALQLVRDTQRFGAMGSTPSTEGVPPQVREATSLIQAIQAASAYQVPKNVAMQVPAFVKALKTYSHLIASLPLREYVREDVTTPRAFLRQPSRQSTYTAVMARTVTDLLLHDEAYWRVVERTWDGFPAAIDYMPWDEISQTPDPSNPMAEFPNDGTVYWNGVRVPNNQVIRFDGDGLGGWLKTGAAAVNTAAALEAAALQSAQVPSPSIVLKNTGADLPASQVDDLLEAWETARTNRSTAYLNSTIDTHSLGGWSPSDLQLTDARNAAATQIARMANLDPVWVGAGVPGSSLTYQNRVDLMRQFLDLSASAPMRMITERLSMDDVTPRGHTVAFETDALLKANVPELANVISAMAPLGVITTDEARQMLDLVEMGAEA